MRITFQRVLNAALVIFLSTSPVIAQEPVADTATGIIRGDVNFDGAINNLDINAFILCLLNPDEYKSQYKVSALFSCDIDNNGLVDYDDIAGFVRLYSPKAPQKVQKAFSGESSTGLPYLTANGRYLTKRHEMTNFDLHLVDKFEIYDSYSDTSIEVRIPEKFNFFTHIRHTLTDISANGDYIAFTVIKFHEDFEQNRQIYTSIVRYNLRNGEADIIDEVGYASAPSLSADGQRMVFAGPENTFYLKDFKANTLKELSKVENRTYISTPQISDDGKYAVVPTSSYRLRADGSVTPPENLSSSRSEALIDLKTGNIIKQLVSQNTGEEFTYYNAAMSFDGRYTFFDKRITALGNMIQLVVYDRVTDEEKILDNIAVNRIVDQLSISGDGTFVTFHNRLINQLTGEKYEFPGMEEVGSYAEFGTLSQDGCYIGLRATDIFILPNPLKSCTRPKIAGDYNRDGKVDRSDYSVIRSYYGKTVTPYSNADGNGDGIVNRADYTIWRDNIDIGTAEQPRG